MFFSRFSRVLKRFSILLSQSFVDKILWIVCKKRHRMFAFSFSFSFLSILMLLFSSDDDSGPIIKRMPKVKAEHVLLASLFFFFSLFSRPRIFDADSSKKRKSRERKENGETLSDVFCVGWQEKREKKRTRKTCADDLTID